MNRPPNGCIRRLAIGDTYQLLILQRYCLERFAGKQDPANLRQSFQGLGLPPPP